MMGVIGGGWAEAREWECGGGGGDQGRGGLDGTPRDEERCRAHSRQVLCSSMSYVSASECVGQGI